MSTFLSPHVNHGRRHYDRAQSEEDYHTYVTRLEKKTSMIEGPRFGNMQHAFKQVEVYEEVDKEFETAGRFGKSKHMGKVENNGRRTNMACEEAETETVEYLRKQDFLFRA